MRSDPEASPIHSLCRCVSVLCRKPLYCLCDESPIIDVDMAVREVPVEEAVRVSIMVVNVKKVEASSLARCLQSGIEVQYVGKTLLIVTHAGKVAVLKDTAAVGWRDHIVDNNSNSLRQVPPLQR